MKKTFRRAIACILAVLMVVLSMPFSAFASEANPNWWQEDGLENVPGGITETPSVAAYFDEYYGYGEEINLEEGATDYRYDYKPVLAFTVSDLGTADLWGTSALYNANQARYTNFYGNNSKKSYEEASQYIVNPAELKAGQRIAVTIEVGGVDIINSADIKGRFNPEYLQPANWKTVPRNKDSWTLLTGAACDNAWMRTTGNFGNSTMKSNAQYCNYDAGSFSLFLMGESAPTGASNYFMQDQDRTSGAYYGRYGAVLGTITFQVLQDCDLTEILWLQAPDYSLTPKEEGTIWEPYACATLGGSKIDGVTQWRIGVNDSVYDTFATFGQIWSKYEKATPVAHKHAFDGTPVADGLGNHIYACTAEGCPGGEDAVKLEACKPATDKVGAVAPTCTEAGSTGDTVCATCDDVMTPATEIPAKGHDMQQTAAAVAATCTTDGKTAVLTCANGCGTVTGGEKITATGHTPTAWVHDAATSGETSTHSRNCEKGDNPETQACTFTYDIVTPATETTEGTGKYTCSVCNYSYEVTLDKVDCTHADTTVVGAQAATCTEDGYSGDTFCNVCKQTIATGTTIAAKGHTEQVVAGKDATCTEAGLTEGKVCTVCNAVLVEQTEIPAKGHTEEVVAGKDATCTEAGLTEGKVCTVCGTVLTEQTEIPAKGHTEEVVAGKDATCTEAGLTEGKVCTVCGTVLAEQTEIPAKGHTEKVVAGKDATCTEAGLTDGKVCEVCGTVLAEQTEIPAKGHTEEVVAGKDATVDEAGLTEGKVCSVCGTVLVEQTEIPMIPSYTVTVDAQDMGGVTINGVDAKDGATVKVAKEPVGTVTLVATAPEGVEFIGWTANGITLVSTDATFVPAVLANVTYTPVFAQSEAAAFTVTFVDSYGNVIDTQTVAAGTAVVEPTAPARAGYTFTDWSMTAEEIDALTASATVTANYEIAAAAGFTVTAEGCTITGSGIDAADEATGVAYDTRVTVTAAGAKSWTIDGVPVAYGETYTFYVGSDVTVVPVFDGADVATAPTVANVKITDTVDANGKLKWTFLATRSMEGFQCVNFGFVYSKTGALDIDLDKVDGNNVKATYCKTTAEQFSLTYGLSAQSGTVSVRAFVAYVDGNGDTQVSYADTQTKSYDKAN